MKTKTSSRGHVAALRGLTLRLQRVAIERGDAAASADMVLDLIDALDSVSTFFNIFF